MTGQGLKGGRGQGDAHGAGRTQKGQAEGGVARDLNPGTTATRLEGLRFCVLGKAEGNPKDMRLGVSTQCSIWKERNITVVSVLFFFQEY